MTDTGNEEKVIYSSSLLFGKSPIESMEILKLRQNQLKFINRELADWFTAYGRLRLQYVDELKKLRIRGEKAFVDTTNPTLQNTKIDSLGLCTPMWSSVMKIINHEITLFDSSTRKMGRDMIAPLKTYSRNNDSNLIEMDDLISLAHNIDSREKNGKDSSLLRNEWSERAPYFFEIFENYDYERLLLLKDIFLKYETDLNDVVEVFKKENETALEHCLAFNPTDEIQRFSDDAMKTEFPIENIKESINESDKSNQFTSSSANTDSNHNSRHRHSEINDNSNGQVDKKSHRKSKLFSSNPLSLGHHHNNSKTVNSSRTNSVATNNTVVHTAPPVIGGGSHASEVASISSSGTSNTKKEKKEKTSMRSKFGSMLRKKKKSKDTPKFSSNLSATPIPESETSSLAASVSNVNISNNNNNNAISNATNASSTRRSSTIQPYQQQTERSAPNDYLPQTPNTPLTAPNSVQGNNYQNQKQPALPHASSSSYTDAPVNDIKPLPKDSAYDQLTTPTSTSAQPLPLPRTESFPTMQPTRRSNSVNSGITQSSIQPSMTESPIKTQQQSYASNIGINNAPVYQEEESPIQDTTPIPPIQNSLDYNNNLSGTAPPPPPPSARKHLSAPLDMISPINNYQEKSIVSDTTPSISSANINGGTSSLAPSSSMSEINGLRTSHHQPPPPPPQQRRALSMADSITEGQVSSQSITPVATGSSSIRQQNTGVIARNTTGSGGLINGQIQHPSLTKPGLNASIVELYNATFKDGELSRSNAVGEVAFSYILGDETQQIPQKIDLEVKSSDELPTFMPNPQFLQQISNSTYSIFDPSQIYLKTVGAMKYMLNDPTPPIVITPIWKHESTKSTVMISIKPSDEIIEKLSADPSLSLKLSSVLISVSLDNAQTISAATKPAGSFNKERNRVTWNFSTTGLTFNSEHLEDKFISRFMLTGNENNAKEGDGGVQIRFNILNENGTDLCQSDISKFGFYINEEKVVDPFSSQDNFNSNKTEDDSNWTEVPILKTLIAGGYSGHA
ncbi:hypothetical protein B5S31_g309 [[Candida] boidinii]|nr:hypothetical protein B5S31_g309 [[Candida] boidinii]